MVNRAGQRETLRRLLAAFAAASLLMPDGYPAASAQSPAPAATQAQPQSGDAFSIEQIDALLAPIALYPDQLLMQILIASTFPLQVVEAERWLQDPAHKNLTGDALTKALQPLAWDPSVKSLVPFPQVLAQMNGNLDWMQQLGYAFANQQKDVMDSVQRLRRQAQAEGNLQTTSQQVVRTETPASGAPSQPTVIIEPAQPDIVYVPSYSPTTVYGAWPYPTYPPVVMPPLPGYVAGTALLGGLAFGTGVALTAGLWGWGSPNWAHGNVNVNVNRWNNINVNRQRMTSNVWNPTVNRPAGRPMNLQRPPAGPVGRPVRTAGLPANAIGRTGVNVPGNLVNRPQRTNTSFTPQNRPNLSPGHRPNPPASARAVGTASRPAGGVRPTQNVQRPANGAFSGVGQGRRDSAFSNRGAQSRQFSASRPSGGPRGGGGFQRRSR